MGLAECQHLTHLTLRRLTSLTDLTPLAMYTKLVHLELDDCQGRQNGHGIADLSPLAECQQLTHITMHHLSNVTDLTPLAECQQLAYFHVLDCGQRQRRTSRHGVAHQAIAMSSGEWLLYMNGLYSKRGTLKSIIQYI